MYTNRAGHDQTGITNRKTNRTLTCNGITLINMRFNTIHVVSRFMNKIPSLQNVEKKIKLQSSTTLVHDRL